MEHPAAPPSTLVLAPGQRLTLRESQATAVRQVTDRDVFRDLLRAARPSVVVVCAPPGTAEDIAAVALERRRRRDMRALLVDGPSEVSERMHALQAGFDQAVDERVGPEELVGRIELLAGDAQRSAGSSRVRLSRDVTLDLERHELQSDGYAVHLRPRESDILGALARDPGRTFSREELLALVGGSRHGDARSIDVHVTWLRLKLESMSGDRPLLATVRGVGYRLERRPRR
jgi:DNA-binding response OmpR family regulator